MKLFEDIFDDIDDEDIVDNEVEDIKEEKPEFFQHHIDYQLSSSMNYKKERAFTKIIKKYMPIFVSGIKYIDSFKIAFYDVIDKEYIDGMDGKRALYQIRLFFNIDNTVELTLGKIFYLLKAFYKLMLWMNTRGLIEHTSYYMMDGNINFSFASLEYQTLCDMAYHASTCEKNIKHFVRMFNNSRSLILKIDNLIDGFKNYRGSGQKDFNFKAMFCSIEDYKKCIVERNDGRIPTVIIPEGVTVGIHDANLFCNFKVYGTLVINRNINKDCVFYNNCFSNFYRNITHNRIIFKMNYLDAPSFNDFRRFSTINFLGLRIKSLEITSDDMYVEDAAELEEVVTLKGTEHVKDIKFNVEEVQ